MTTQTDANKALLDTLFEAVNQADFALLDPHPGFYETRQYVPPMHQLFSDWRTTHMQQIAEADLVFSVGRVAVTHQAPFAGVQPTGKRVYLDVLSLDQVQDGLVVQHNSASTWATVLRQLDVPAFNRWPLRDVYTLEQTTAPVPLATLDANKAAVRDVLVGLSKGHIPQHIHQPRLHQLVDQFVAWRRAFPALTFEPITQIAEGSLVATRGMLRGTHLGALYGFPATGRQIHWDFFCLARVENGVVMDEQSLADWNAALSQLGLMPM